MPTRTLKIASVHPAPATWTAAVVVPVGLTYIVKSALILNLGGVADTIYLTLLDAVATVHIVNAVVLASGASLSWEGWHVLSPGDTLRVFSLNGNSYFWLSGAKLSGIA